ncbi:MAG: serine hydrolase domain-containing protein [Acidobacteriota bacterium]
MNRDTHRRTVPPTSRIAVVLTCILVAAAAGAAQPDQATERRLADALRLLDVWIAEQIAYHGVPGLAIGVVHGDRVLWAKGYGRADLKSGAPVTTATPFRLGSVTKVFTATAAMQLRDRGELSLDDPLSRHLPWFAVRSPYASAPPITLRHLLTHTSGLPREGAFPYWTTHTFPSREEVRAGLAGQTVFSPPGATYRYSNLGMTLLGEVVESASGEAYAAYLARHVFAPLGMTSSTAAPDAAQIAALARAYQRRRPGESRREIAYYDTGVFAPMGGVVSTVEDLGRFLALQLTADAGGALDPARVLAPPTLAEMQRAQFVYPSFTGGRGLGFAVSRRDGVTLVGHGGWIGGHRADLLLDPAHKVGVAVLTNADDAAPGPFARRALEMVGAALDGPPAPRTEKQPDPAWSRYVGTYTDPWGWEFEVLVLDGELAVYEHNYPPDDDPGSSLTRLKPVPGEPHAFVMGDGERLTFVLDADGSVRHMVRRYDVLTPVR